MKKNRERKKAEKEQAERRKEELRKENEEIEQRTRAREQVGGGLGGELSRRRMRRTIRK